MAGALAGALPVRAAPGCPAARFEATLLQILRTDAARPALWPAVMRRLAQFGLRDVILQWSSADATDFYPGRAGATDVIPVLPDIVGAARGAGLRTWLGLHYGSDWWSAAARPDAALGPFLDARLADLRTRVPPLAALARRREVAGWYVTDELDDVTWRTAEREAALTHYLRATVALLRRTAPGRPVAASAFANGADAAASYAAQLRRIADAAGLDRLLLQDGIGAGKCSPDQARTVATALATAMAGSATRVGMIVEFFDPARPAGTTQPASIDDILARTAATAGLGGLPATSFSHAHHLTELGGALAAERGAAWLAVLARCAPAKPRRNVPIHRLNPTTGAE